MDFIIDTADALKIENVEISELLSQVYVAGGYTAADDAATLFDPVAVRARGILIGARESQDSALAGMIIVVLPDSPARRFAGNDEAELHLLGVRPEYRKHGAGRRLVEAAIEQAARLGYLKLILWTQLSMSSAQRLYESAGFCHIGNFERNGREFKLYARGSGV